ncbi:MAG: uracil-DNA glycosylase family protein [Prevotella sp.]|nr:uracil-DNA glycosylase family protein [Prevotella sp.]
MNVEIHPWAPFLPEGCRLLVLGSFPPARKRWSMDFFYPNYTNDFWRICGICFHDDKLHFVDEAKKTYRRERIEQMLREKKIGLYDTASAVRRLKNTASDKDLEVVEPTDVAALLRQIPACRAVCTTGQKATDVLCEQFAIKKSPEVGHFVEFTFDNRQLRLYRMPSSSRAYPMAVERKAAFYQPMFEEICTP